MKQLNLNDFLTKSRTNLEKSQIANRRKKSIVDIPKPFMKWAGGKRQLLSQINNYLPETYNTYFEPFVGGGAMFFYLLPPNSVLIDINEELINAYKVIKNNIEELIPALKQHINDKDYYYKIRKLDRNPIEYSELTDVQRASRIIYMNKTCYNGLYRVNKSGEFNVPFGEYKNPKICDEENLRAISNALQNVKIYHDSFIKVLDLAKKNDFIYFDPPYAPLSSSANFTNYNKEDFGFNEQKTLFQTFKKLDKRGCKILLSNSYIEFILDLYQDYNIHELTATRQINSDPSKRGKIKEVLVSNF